MQFPNRAGLLLALIVLTSGMATASPASLNLFPDSSSTRINSFTSYELTVENTGPAKDVYTLSSSSPSEITIAPQRVKLQPGNSETVNVWYNPRIDREEGTYSFELTATSRATGDRFTTTGQVEVIKDHQVSLQVEDAKTSCLGQKAVYNVEVENSGIQPEEFSISSDFGKLSRKSVNLEDGESTTLTLELSSKKPVQRNFNVVAASKTSYAQDIENVQFNAETCYDSEISITPQNQETAAYTEAEFEVTVRNLGTKSDTFTLSTSRGELSETQLQVDAGSTRTTTVSYTPEQLGQRNIRITASGNSEASKTARVNAYNGMSSEISFSNSRRTVCEDESATFEAEISNTGEAEETFNLTASRGELSESSVELSPGDSEEVKINVDSSTPLGTHRIRLSSTATTFGEPATTKSSTLVVENCWDLQMNVVPEVTSAGENRSVIYEIQLNNTGTRENTYNLSSEGPEWISVKPEQVTVGAGETATAYMYAGIPFQKKGEVEITANAEGNEVKRSQTVRLLIDQQIEDSIENGENNLTGGFFDSITGAFSNIGGGENAGRIGLSVILGAIITAGVYYLL